MAENSYIDDMLTDDDIWEIPEEPRARAQSTSAREMAKNSHTEGVLSDDDIWEIPEGPRARAQSTCAREMAKNSHIEGVLSDDDIWEIPEEPRARAHSANSPKNSSSEQPPSELRKKHSTSEPTLPVMDKHGVNTDWVPNGRKRSSSHIVLSSTKANYYIQNHSATLTEKAKNLSEEEIEALVIDIFKPLDFYEILFDRMKKNDHKQESNAGESLSDPQ